MPDQDFWTSKYVALAMRGMNDAEKSSPRERHFKVSESHSDSCHSTGVCIAPKQAPILAQPSILAAISKTVVWKSK
jgi:hypothetical protein